MKRSRATRVCLSVGVFAAMLALVARGEPAAAYKIFWPRLHEAFVAAAEQCLDDARGAEPLDCKAQRESIAGRAKLQFALTNLQREVRWSDDPLRQIKTAAALKALLNSDAGLCEDILKRSQDPSSAGLFCAGHFGRLQFIHAMRSSPEEELGVTRAKILDWAEFTYKVARGEIREDVKYCDYFSQNSSSISAAMKPDTFRFCGSSPNDGWTIASLFSWHCTNPGPNALNGGRCGVLTGEQFVQTVAKGALLHMIQDSYSQSHALRAASDEVDDKGRFKPIVGCEKPRMYRWYSLAESKRHKAADKLPTWLKSCDESREADDIITATARTLYYLDGGKGWPEYRAYLESRVL